MGKQWIVVVVALALATACGDAPETEETGEDAAFVKSREDEVLDPADPPNDPDPADDPIAVANIATQGNGGNGGCAKRSDVLSPKGLTLVIHISKDKGNGEDAVRHLVNMRGYLRARDIFMVERTTPMLDQLQKTFPCNSFHFIAYPSEVDNALQTGGRIDGIAMDWEGGQVEGNGVGYSVDKLAAFAKKVRASGRTPGFVPAWSPRFDDAAIARAAKMDYELAQIQPACVNSPAAFGHRARDMLVDFKRHGIGLRNVGFEISMNSYGVAPNNVGPDRAADCTEIAYRKGARSIYLYGNGPDHLVPYLQKLGKRGLRKKR